MVSGNSFIAGFLFPSTLIMYNFKLTKVGQVLIGPAPQTPAPQHMPTPVVSSSIPTLVVFCFVSFGGWDISKEIPGTLYPSIASEFQGFTK